MNLMQRPLWPALGVIENRICLSFRPVNTALAGRRPWIVTRTTRGLG